jgi:hypothetical protein
VGGVLAILLIRGQPLLAILAFAELDVPDIQRGLALVVADCELCVCGQRHAGKLTVLQAGLERVGSWMRLGGDSHVEYRRAHGSFTEVRRTVL